MGEKIQVGDKVTFTGKEGVVVSIDYDSDRITVDVSEKNGGHNLHYGHITQFRPELVEVPLPFDDDSDGKHTAKKAVGK